MHLSYRDPVTKTPRRYGSGIGERVREEGARAAYHRWLEAHLNGETPKPQSAQESMSPRTVEPIPSLAVTPTASEPGNVVDIASGLIASLEHAYATASCPSLERWPNVEKHRLRSSDSPPINPSASTSPRAIPPRERHESAASASASASANGSATTFVTCIDQPSDDSGDVERRFPHFGRVSAEDVCDLNRANVLVTAQGLKPQPLHADDSLSDFRSRGGNLHAAYPSRSPGCPLSHRVVSPS